MTELSLCYSIVYHYNGAQWYEQFSQVGRLGRTLISRGLDFYLPSASIFGLHAAVYIYIFLLYFLLFILVS